MSRKNHGNRSALIHCPSCGEDYSDAYRRCPFCNAKRPKGRDEYDESEYDGSAVQDSEELYEEVEPAPYYDEDQDDAGYQQSPLIGGKRLAGSNRRGGGYGRRAGPGRIILYIIALLLLAAIIWLVVTMLMPRLSGCAPARESPTPTATPSVLPSPIASPSPAPAETDNGGLPDVSPAPVPSEVPTAAPVIQCPATQAPAGLTLSREDFTLSNAYPTYTVKATGATGTVTWSIKDTSVATVSSSGLVTAVAPGSTTLTATDESGATATCIVRVAKSFTGESQSQAPTEPPATQVPTEPPATQTPGESAAPADGLTLSREDFTLSSTYPTYTVKATGATGAVTWTIKDTSVATVSANGLVTAVANGTTTLTATDESGATATCIVRVRNFSGE